MHWSGSCFWGIALGLVLSAGIAAAAEDEPALDWQEGPLRASIGADLAEIDVPEGYVFLDAAGSMTLMELMENPVSGQEVGTLAPTSDEASWFLIFEWEEIGWVDDTEKDELDAEAMLESIRAGTEAGNEERQKRGWATVEIVGWHERPHYDPASNNLTWAIIGSTGGEQVINRNIKLLGRRGVMTVTLVANPTELTAVVPLADTLLASYGFQEGNRYAEFVKGQDKIATYGLTALVVGGAGAALVKSGLLARFWKLLVVAVVGVGAAVRRFFTGTRAEDSPTTQV